MNHRQIDVFEECIKLMETGVPLEDCLKKYPDLETRMQDILEIAGEVMSLREERVSIEQMDRNRIKLLSQAKLLGSSDKQNASASVINQFVKLVKRIFLGFSSLSPFPGRLVIVLGITGLLILFSGGLFITSAKSLPGDSLYPVKRAVEEINVYLAPRGELQNVEANYGQQRLEEVKKLIELKRIQRISFEGNLELMSSTNWVVSGIPISLQTDTTVVGAFEGTQSFGSGSLVEVEGITNGQGWVVASEIHLREYRFIGMVEKIDVKTWQVSGIQLFITSRTQIDPGIRVGDDVTVLIRSEDSGLYALAILSDVHPTATPIIPQSLPDSSPPSNDPTPIIEEEHQIIGTLDKISGNYWVVSGQIVYIVGDTHISNEVKIGDSLSIDYRIEANGSFTAIDIERIENDALPEENQLQETPEAGGELVSHDSSIGNTTADKEKEESTHTPEYHRTPEPTENHVDAP